MASFQFHVLNQIDTHPQMGIAISITPIPKFRLLSSREPPMQSSTVTNK
jgi:hypothetical protein